MHPYIPHLLDDIAKAHRGDYTPAATPAMSFEEEMEALEDWDNLEPEHTFGYYCGLDPVNFPPPEQLKVKDIKLVNKAFQAMMHTWNLSIDLPRKMPAKVAYTFIVDCLNEKVPIVDSGFVSIDFCTGYAPGCRLKEYCPCIEFYNDLPDFMDDTPGDPDQLPF